MVFQLMRSFKGIFVIVKLKRSYLAVLTYFIYLILLIIYELYYLKCFRRHFFNNNVYSNEFLYDNLNTLLNTLKYLKINIV